MLCEAFATNVNGATSAVAVTRKLPAGSVSVRRTASGSQPPAGQFGVLMPWARETNTSDGPRAPVAPAAPAAPVAPVAPAGPWLPCSDLRALADRSAASRAPFF